VRSVVITAAALAALVSCTDLPDRVGALAPCVQIDAAAFEGALADGAAYRRIDLTNGGYRANGARHSLKRCWPRIQGLNSAERRCVQRNELVVEMRTDEAVTHFRIPPRTTHLTYGEAGRAVCQVVMQENE
jgi:hypothetical protein